MRGGKKERKMLHEHEAFLFIFTILFIFGGFIFWSHSGLALDYSVGEDSILGALDVEAGMGVEKVINLDVKNPSGDLEATIIYELDVQCSELIIAEEEVIEEIVEEVPEEEILIDETLEGCDYVDVQLNSNTIYPDESVTLTLTFLSEVIGEGEVYLSVATDYGVDFLQFNVDFLEAEEEIEESSLAEEAESILDILIEAIQNAGEVISTEEVDEVVEEESEPITDVQSSVGLTTSYLNFGVLDFSKGEQETIVVEIENLKSDSDLTFLEIQGGDVEGLIVTYDLDQSSVIGTGGRYAFEVTCVPPSEGVFAEEDLIIKTSYDDIKLDVVCVGGTVEEEVVDETPPFIEIVSPEGQVQGVVPVVINTYDEGDISSDPAVLRFYLNKVLVGRVTKFPINFNFDSSRFEDGLYVLTVVAVDHAGNSAADSGPLWINNGDATLRSVLYDSGLLDKGFVFEVDTGEGYSTIDSGTEMGDGEFNLRVKYSLGDWGEDITIELKGMNLNDKLDIPFGEGDIQKIVRNIWNQEIRLIDIDGDGLKAFIETTDAETIIMPMMLKKGTFSDEVGFTDIPTIYYYRSDGTEPFDITNDIVSIVKVSDVEDEGENYVLVNVEIPVNIIMGE
jgi:hypothetical protein